MASSTRKQIFTMHMLPNISRSKSNQTLKFGQLIEYSMRNPFIFQDVVKSGAPHRARLVRFPP